MTDDAHSTTGARSLVDALAQTAFLVTAVLSEVGAQHELSLTQVRVLGILRGRRLRMAELADYLGLERSTMSGLIDRAERRGLLARERNTADGRAIDVALTDAGRELTERAYRQIGAELQPALDRLSAPRQRELGSLIDELLGPEQLVD